MNLRLPEDLALAMRDLASRTGRSQQDLAREALEEYVRDYDLRDFPAEIRWTLTPPSRPYRSITPRTLPGVTGTQGSDALIADRRERGDQDE